MRPFFALLCLLFSTSLFAAIPAEPLFKHVGTADGLPSTGTNALAIDHDGYLWIATHDGLVRYDGVSYRVYRHVANDESSLPGNYVQTLHVDAGNRIWVGVEGAGLSMLDTARRGFRHINRGNHPLMRSDDVWAIDSTRDGALWFGTYAGGLYRIDAAGTPRERMTRFLPARGNPHSLPDANIITLAVDRAGTLWIGTTRGLARWTDHGFDTLPPDSLSSRTILSLSPEADGSLWVGGDHGMDRIRVDGSLERPAWSAHLLDAGVTSVLRDERGDLWIATETGLMREHAGVIERFTETMVGHVTIFQALADAEGGLWFASSNDGLFRLSAGWRNFSVVTSGARKNALGNVDVTGAANASDGRVWLVGTQGVLDRLDPDDGPITHVLLGQKSLPSTALKSVAERRDGSIWIGHGQGLSRYRPDTGAVTHWYIGDGKQDLLPGPVNRLLETDDGLLWVASYGGGLQARDGDGRVVYSLRLNDGQGLESPDLTQLAAGPDHMLWVSGPAGLQRWDRVEKRLLHVEGASEGTVYGFAFASANTLWIHRMAAIEGYHWNGRRLHLFRVIAAEHGLPAIASGGLAIDHEGALWLPTLRGLFRYDPAHDRLRHFGSHDGLPSSEFGPIAPLVSAHGTVLVSSRAGLVVFDPAAIRTNNKAPALVIDAISLRRGEEVLDLPVNLAELTLEPQDRDLRINARLLSFVDPQAHRYRFWLHGYDPDWVNVDERGERIFSRLDAGEYRLEVVAANADGAWSAPRGFRLIVRPPWWRSGAAIFVWVVSIISVLMCIALIYRRRLRARHTAMLREQSRQLAEQGSEAKSRFLANLGHEIRTPMTGVLGMSELLLGGDLDERQRRQVESIQRAGQHLLRLVNDALDLACVEAGKLTLQDEPFDLHVLLEEVAALLRPSAHAKHLLFALQRSPGTPRFLRGDAGRVRQILLNLGTNAIKFTAHGEVAIRSAPLPGGGLILEVTDTGPGLNAQQQARLFQRFEQAEGALTAQRYGGSGLGLAISQELAAAMQGRIEVQSDPGAGAIFRVMLPLANAAHSEVGLPSLPLPMVAGTSLRLLVVEDDVMIAEVVVDLLRSLGHQVALATQALSALSELRNGDIDLAFIDLDLPGLDGFELSRIIQSQGHACALVAITARADPQAETQAFAAGMHGFVRKPVNSAMLTAVMMQAMPHWRRAEERAASQAEAQLPAPVNLRLV
ncbi:MAG TPA: two-component regulator propeller domain-containing protein [Arenimonas sp.]|uniref:two-component regulator propeller domain-containing protein n=1 Tax=Arenimonas sp. TaxID=1872635 RepID=UPI002B89CC62|nr:two-component regulator propeller domain-containing protein [Arenimonas sp.]HMB57022.1 two-component regulator propeller domain-containing protein [Arenimonas sp.]